LPGVEAHVRGRRLVTRRNNYRPSLNLTFGLSRSRQCLLPDRVLVRTASLPDLPKGGWNHHERRRVASARRRRLAGFCAPRPWSDTTRLLAGTGDGPAGGRAKAGAAAPAWFGRSLAHSTGAGSLRWRWRSPPRWARTRAKGTSIAQRRGKSQSSCSADTRCSVLSKARLLPQAPDAPPRRDRAVARGPPRAEHPEVDRGEDGAAKQGRGRK
jgi:hypothetical protein